MNESLHLRKLRQAIASKLLGIEDMLPKEYALTLIARHTTNEEAHIIVSVEDDENLRKASECIVKLVDDPNSIVSNRAIGV